MSIKNVWNRAVNIAAGAKTTGEQTDMASILEFLPMMARQFLARQSLMRVPEPDMLLDEPQQVANYEEMALIPLVLTYVMAQRQIGRLWRGAPPVRLLDLASGPGHFALLLSRAYPDAQVTGIDLAPNMAAAANANAARMGRADRCRFQVGDVTRLEAFADGGMDIVTCTNSAHHLPTLDMVGGMLTEMDRVARPDGLILVFDSGRLKTEALTADYVEMVGGSALESGLDRFYMDFQHSMHASWTPAEFASAVPRRTRRTWWQVVPFGLPSTQILVGLPQGETRFYAAGAAGPDLSDLIPGRYRQEWQALQLAYALARKTRL